MCVCVLYDGEESGTGDAREEFYKVCFEQRLETGWRCLSTVWGGWCSCDVMDDDEGREAVRAHAMQSRRRDKR